MNTLYLSGVLRTFQWAEGVFEILLKYKSGSAPPPVILMFNVVKY